MMEKRLKSQDGGDCTIANLQSKIGQLEKELKRAYEELGHGAKSKEGGIRSDSPKSTNDDLDTTHRAKSLSNIEENLDTSHQGLCSPGCRNLNRQEGAISKDSGTTHQGETFGLDLG